MAGLLTAAGPAATVHEAPGQRRIGPNAVIQLAAALRSRLGEQETRSVFARAGLLSMLTEPPADMVDQQAVATLYDALFRHLPTRVAVLAAAEAGTRTADYLLAHRIPRPARLILRCLPAAWALPVLLRAIAANAWTFAGTGRVLIRNGRPSTLEIHDNPIATPGCVWHVAVFERLLQSLVSPRATVSHPQCCRDGGDFCRFEMRIPRDRSIGQG